MFRGAAVGQVDEHDVAGGALDEGTDGRSAVLADDQVALPMTGNGPVLDLGRAVADHDHGVREPRLSRGGLAVGSATGASGSQCLGEFAAEFATALDVEGLVNHLVDHVHLRPIGKAFPKSVANLFRAPPSAQVVLDEVAQPRLRPIFPTLGRGRRASARAWAAWGR